MANMKFNIFFTIRGIQNTTNPFVDHTSSISLIAIEAESWEDLLDNLKDQIPGNSLFDTIELRIERSE